MKNILFKSIKVIALSVLISAGIPCSAQFVGQWKCDETGSHRSVNQADETVTMPITEFYAVFNGSPFEIRFNQDQTFQIITSNAQASTSLKYQIFYDNDPSKVLLRDESDHSEDIVMTIKSLTPDVLVADFEVLEDDFVMMLTMNRVALSDTPTLPEYPFSSYKIHNSKQNYICVDHGVVGEQVEEVADCPYKVIEIDFDIHNVSMGIDQKIYKHVEMHPDVLQSFLNEKNGHFQGTAWWCNGKIIAAPGYNGCQPEGWAYRLIFKM